MQLPNTIPQIDQEHETWQRFLQKACMGSDKAVRMLSCSAMAFAAHLAGPHILDSLPYVQYEQILSSGFPAQSPFQHPQDLADLVAQAGYTPHPFTMQAAPLLDYQAYNALWKRHITVAPADALHDAILFCCKHWSRATFLELIRTVEATDPNYNSQDAIAAMLGLTIAWANLRS